MARSKPIFSPPLKVDMNTFAFLFGIQAAGQLTLRIAFTIALLLPQGIAIFIYKQRDQFFGRDPKVNSSATKAGT